jgi:5-methylcytosine-specific restriction enzyme A
MPAAWAGSDRRARLPANWRFLRARILRRDPTCQICGLNASVEVDHIAPGDDHSPANLQGLCRHCHKTKTQAEAIAAQPRRRRDEEPHPGIIANEGNPQ